MKKILVMASVMMLGASGAWALGTAAGTNISNSASLTYSAGGVDQTDAAHGGPKTSNTDQFVVDNKIDLTVGHSDTTIVPVVPGATAQVLTFTVTNTGNKVQDYSLTSTANDGNPFAGETDNFDATNVHVFVDTNGNGTYEAGTDTDTYIDELSPDTNITVFIVADIPAGQANNDVAEYTLTAQVAQGGTSGTQGGNITGDTNGHGVGSTNVADDAATEQIVFADGDGNGATDGANDGKYADYDAYKVVTAVLDLTKLSCVISDPVNGVNANAKRIPGAVIAHVFDINNTGSATATGITITDDLVPELDETTVTVQELESNTGATACTCANGSGNGTAGTNSTPVNSQATHDIEVNAGTVNAGNHSCLEVRVDLK